MKLPTLEELAETLREYGFTIDGIHADYVVDSHGLHEDEPYIEVLWNDDEDEDCHYSVIIDSVILDHTGYDGSHHYLCHDDNSGDTLDISFM